MNTILGKAGAILMGLFCIAATVVALVPAKITNKGSIWTFAIGLAVALIVSQLWKMGTLISSRRTTDVAGAVIFIVSLVLVALAITLVVLYLKEFTWLQAGWGFLSGALLAIGYLAHKLMCLKNGHRS